MLTLKINISSDLESHRALKYPTGTVDCRAAEGEVAGKVGIDLFWSHEYKPVRSTVP